MINRQNELFARIRNRMQDPSKMADELAVILGISKDSVYRRIKGEKPLLFEEIFLLSKTFDISLDEILSIGGNNIVLQGQFVNENDFDLQDYLGSIIRNLEALGSRDQAKLYYISKDIPLFYYLMFPAISAFKFFVWAKSQMQFTNSSDKPFSDFMLTPELGELCHKAAMLYASIPSIEILNPDNILNDLRQLAYYKDAGLIRDGKDFRGILDELDQMVDHMETQATLGCKLVRGDDNAKAPFQMYVNDFYIGDNTVIAAAGGVRQVFMNHAAINFLSTSSERFVDYNMDFVNNMIRKSTLVSEVGERTRQRFFALIHQRINKYRDIILQ